jgi:hypothetical protein
VPGVKHDMLYERGRENLEFIARSESEYDTKGVPNL